MIEDVFTVLQAARGLRTGSHDRPVMFGEIVHYIHGSAEVDESRVQEQIASNLVLRRQFSQLLERVRTAAAPKQALAASKELGIDRETRCFTLAFKYSKANADQVYVLLTVHPESGMADGHAPVVLANKEALSQVVRLCFPPLKDHRSQLLLVTDDQRLVLAQDSDAELSLL